MSKSKQSKLSKILADPTKIVEELTEEKNSFRKARRRVFSAMPFNKRGEQPNNDISLPNYLIAMGQMPYLVFAFQHLLGSVMSQKRGTTGGQRYWDMAMIIIKEAYNDAKHILENDANGRKIISGEINLLEEIFALGDVASMEALADNAASLIRKYGKDICTATYLYQMTTLFIEIEEDNEELFGLPVSEVIGTPVFYALNAMFAYMSLMSGDLLHQSVADKVHISATGAKGGSTPKKV